MVWAQELEEAARMLLMLDRPSSVLCRHRLDAKHRDARGAEVRRPRKANELRWLLPSIPNIKSG